ncbi:hypothetical protein Scep_010857 [Stephania cephalantha]|uniref:Uncharacterized protein n=1 Tax=Stephania cephalantha TaxID=152367 RepID=A0AAP0PHN3_9MAGN
MIISSWSNYHSSADEVHTAVHEKRSTPSESTASNANILTDASTEKITNVESWIEAEKGKLRMGTSTGCADANFDDTNYSSPMPVIGLYIAGATLIWYERSKSCEIYELMEQLFVDMLNEFLIES